MREGFIEASFDEGGGDGRRDCVAHRGREVRRTHRQGDVLKVSAACRSNRAHRYGRGDADETTRHRQQDGKRVINDRLDNVSDFFNNVADKVNNVLYDVANSLNNVAYGVKNIFNETDYCAHA